LAEQRASALRSEMRTVFAAFLNEARVVERLADRIHWGEQLDGEDVAGASSFLWLRQAEARLVADEHLDGCIINWAARLTDALWNREVESSLPSQRFSPLRAEVILAMRANLDHVWTD